MYMRRLNGIFPVAEADCLHDLHIRMEIHSGIFQQILEKILLQLGFIPPVARQVPGKETVVGQGKGICGIVNQLA